MAASYPTAVKSFTSRSAGQTISASHVNDVQDEVNAIEAGLLNGTAPLTSSNCAVANLSVSGNSTLAGEVSAAAQPHCALINSTQGIAPGAYVALTFLRESVDVGGLHSTASNPTRVTIPAGSSGWYLATGVVPFQAFSTAADCRVAIRKNGASSAVGAIARQLLPVSGLTQSLMNSQHVFLDGADYLELYAYYDGSTTLGVGDSTLAEFMPQFHVSKLW